MRGPILNYRLGKMMHEEYEAEVSRYWRWPPGDEREPGLAERLRRLVGQRTTGLDRAWCATTRVGPSPAVCGAAR